MAQLDFSNIFRGLRGWGLYAWIGGDRQTSPEIWEIDPENWPYASAVYTVLEEAEIPGRVREILWKHSIFH